MYESFYQMTKKPFQINTDPRFLWLGEKHREALANLKYGLLDRNGFVVLTGDVGTGKTTLVNALLNALGDEVRVAKISHPSLETNEFLSLIAKTLNPDFKLTDKSGLLLFFDAYLQQAYADGKVVLLIVDEAHRLSMELLEEIRLLSNIEHAGQPLLSIIFVGQNEIKPMLKDPQCRALRQRITSFYDIQALRPEETRQYVDYRLQVSGISENMFTTEALQEIHALSGGNPRVINIICDRALLTGYVREQHVIDADVIIECGLELELGERRQEDKGSAAAIGFSKLWRGSGEKLTAISGAAGNTLETAFQRGNSIIGRAANRGRSTARTVLGGMGKLTGDLVAHKRRKLLPAALVSSIVLFFVIVAISAYSGAKLQGKASAAKQRPNPVMEERALVEQASLAVVGSPVTQEAIINAEAPLSPHAEPDNTVKPPAAVNPSPVAAEPTLMERASAAMERKEYQKVLELLEAYPIGAANEDADSVGLYARALVGRAGEVMRVSPDSAETLLKKAIDVSPKMVEPHLMLGKHYTRTKDYPQATEAYERAVELDPSASDALFNLGFIHASTGEFEAAEKAFERVVSLKPPYIGKSLFNLAVVQQKLGKNKESIASLEEVVAMGPENEKALAFLNRLRQSTAGVSEERIR